MDFAPQRAFRGKIVHPHQLLGYRTGAFEPAITAQIVQRRAQNAAKIDPVMRVEAAILDRDHGMDQIRRQLFDLDPVAFGGAARRKDMTVCGCEDHCRTGFVGTAAARNWQGDSAIADKD